MGILDWLFGGGKAEFPPEDLAKIEAKWPGASETPSGMRYVVESAGSGPKPRKGARIEAHYTGTLLSGKKFDSSHDRGKPLAFKVGVGMVIKGWDEGLLDMQEGETRTLIIPSALGYGARGAGKDIPPHATLVFQVELVSAG